MFKRKNFIFIGFRFIIIYLFDRRPAIGLMTIWTSAFDDSKIPVLLFSLIALYAIWNLFCSWIWSVVLLLAVMAVTWDALKSVVVPLKRKLVFLLFSSISCSSICKRIPGIIGTTTLMTKICLLLLLEDSSCSSSVLMVRYCISKSGQMISMHGISLYWLKCSETGNH